MMLSILNISFKKYICLFVLKQGTIQNKIKCEQKIIPKLYLVVANEFLLTFFKFITNLLIKLSVF